MLKKNENLIFENKDDILNINNEKPLAENKFWDNENGDLLQEVRLPFKKGTNTVINKNPQAIKIPSTICN